MSADDSINDIPEQKAIFNRSQIEDLNLYKIENIKTNFMLNYTNMPIADARQQLANILDSMQQIVDKYYKAELAEYNVAMPDGKKYTFAQLKGFILGGFASDRDDIRLVYLAAFNIYDHFAKLIGLEIAMYKNDVKKKTLERLYSLIPNKSEAWFKDFYEGYYKNMKYISRSDDMRAFIPYAVSKMPDFDLDCNSVIIGAARSSKSTLFLHYAREITALRRQLTLNEADEYLVKTNWVRDNIIYSQNKGLGALARNKGAVIGVDEGYLVGDRRNALNRNQIDYTAAVNKYASNNNIIYTLIQNLTDLETRIYDKANLIYLVYERGRALVYARAANFPIIKSTYEFERFQKYTNLLNSGVIQALHNLKSLKSFIAEIEFNDLSGNPLYEAYLPYKKENQGTLPVALGQGEISRPAYSEIPMGF